MAPLLFKISVRDTYLDGVLSDAADQLGGGVPVLRESGRI